MNNQTLQLREKNQADAQEIDVFRIGEVFAESGYFDDAKKASQAIVKILAGREIGIGAMASMSGIHLVQGKATLGANLIASLIKNKKSGYNYRVLELTEHAAEIEFFETGESIGKSRYTIEEAKTAKLATRDMWLKYPKNMLFARALSNGAKWFCPDVFNGVPIYTPEEMGANVDSEGDIIVEPARIAAVPNKTNPVEAQKNLDSFPKLAPAALETNDEANTLIENLKSLYADAGLDSTAAVKKFSGLSLPEKRNAISTTEKFIKPQVRQYRLAQIKERISSDDWGLDENGTAKFIDGYGVGGLDSLTDEQLAEIYKDTDDLVF